MSTLSLAAVSSLERESSIALPADLLITVKLLSNGSNGGIHDAASEPEHEVEG